jgi:GTP cyclohydrolase I
MLPFFGKAFIGYIPNKKVIGISKLARLLDIYSRRLQIQERLTCQISKFLFEELESLGAGCVLKATHLCMQMRGVEKQHSVMVTSSLVGAFREIGVREEFLSLCKL